MALQPQARPRKSIDQNKAREESINLTGWRKLGAYFSFERCSTIAQVNSFKAKREEGRLKPRTSAQMATKGGSSSRAYTCTWAEFAFSQNSWPKFQSSEAKRSEGAESITFIIMTTTTKLKSNKASKPELPRAKNLQLCWRAPRAGRANSLEIPARLNHYYYRLERRLVSCSLVGPFC